MASTTEGAAYRVTVALGTTDEIYDACYVRIDVEGSVVEIFQRGAAGPGTLLATAPLGRTLVQWRAEA